MLRLVLDGFKITKKWTQKRFFYVKSLYIPNICSNFAASKVKRRDMTMEAIVYKTEEERIEALRKMVGMRKIFEARAREIYEKKYGISVAQ